MSSVRSVAKVARSTSCTYHSPTSCAWSATRYAILSHYCTKHSSTRSIPQVVNEYAHYPPHRAHPGYAPANGDAALEGQLGELGVADNMTMTDLSEDDYDGSTDSDSDMGKGDIDPATPAEGL